MMENNNKFTKGINRVNQFMYDALETDRPLLLDETKEKLKKKAYEITHSTRTLVMILSLLGVSVAISNADKAFAADDKEADDIKKSELRVNQNDNSQNEFIKVESSQVQEVMDNSGNPNQDYDRINITQENVQDVFFDNLSTINRVEGNNAITMENLVQKWENRYLGDDTEYDSLRINKANIEKPDFIQMIEAFDRMAKSGDLKVVLQKLEENDMPFETVFLAIAESYWNNDIESHVGAKGYWQFMPHMAKAYGIYKKGKYDYRSDMEKSTDAAIKLLKDNYMVTKRWEWNRKVKWGHKVSESERWKWAFVMFNKGTSMKDLYIKYHGDFDSYVVHEGNEEARNYVPRVIAIGNALTVMYQDAPEKRDQVLAGFYDMMKNPNTRSSVLDVVANNDQGFNDFIKASE